MKIILTGASGFLGNILHNFWKGDHEVICLGRNKPVDIQSDITVAVPLLPKADLVVHSAGKAHFIPRNKFQMQEFYDVNLKGTLNLLKALETNPPKSFVLISTVAVYGLETGNNIDESFPLNAKDAYGKSKIDAEAAVQKWGLSNGVKILILRLPLVIGKNPPGNFGAMIKAINNGYYFRIGKGEAKRSVVFASDIAYLLIESLNKDGVFNLSTPYHPSVFEIDSALGDLLGKKIKVLSPAIANILAGLGDFLTILPFNTGKLRKLTNSLTFSSQKARNQLNWNPTEFSKSKLDFVQSKK